MSAARRLLGMFAFAGVFALTLPVGLPAQGEAAEYGVAVVRNVMVPMRDGVKLATDVYLPARNGAPVLGKFPVLVSRTPYNKDPAAYAFGSLTPLQEKEQHAATFFARHGYVVVKQDCRGRYHSQGKFYLDIHEGPDGYDTVEWAARQPWSDGNVGTYGASYLSQVQNSLAVLRPPHLRAMFIMVGASNYYDEGAYRGGVFNLLHNLAYALMFSATSQEAAKDPALRTAMLEAGHQQLGAWLRAYPFRPNASPLLASPINERWFKDMRDHPFYDAYWKQNGYDFEVAYDKYPDIPVYFLSGWYDLFLHGSLHNYMGLASRHKSLTKLMVGPWVHGIGPRFSGDVGFGATAEVDLLAQMQRWFDHFLKGKDTGIARESPVRLFVMGGGNGQRTTSGRMEDGGAWINTTAWPVPGATSHLFYLHANGVLSEEAPAGEKPTSFMFDPKHPVPTIGGQIDSGKDFSPDGPRDQRCNLKIFGCDNDLPLSSRRDVLVFQTPPLESDVAIAGPVTVDLWISSSAPDTDLTAKLVDVAPANTDYPQGYAMNLADRITRVRGGDNATSPWLLKRGEIRKVTVDLLGVANRFATGHRIRIDISSSNFPFFAVNPNTGAREGNQTHEVTAVNTVYHDQQHPS
ncbi:MAG: CocE/NonD family hydrolase, partial [Terriglobia bacterium]